MGYQIVFLDRVELTPVSLRELENVGRVSMVPVSTQEDLISAVREADALLYQLSPLPFTREVLEGCHRLKVIGRIGIGVDQVDLAAASDRGITVVNAAGTQAAAVADHAMALMLCLARNVVAAHTALLAGDRSPPWNFMGCELDGKTLGIIGFGAIGRRLAHRALAFGMTVQAYDPYLPSDTMEQAGATQCDLAELLAGSDFVSIHAPLTHETRHLIGADELGLMRSGAYLINAARGPIIDQPALVSALQRGVIAGAGLDVFEEEPLAADSPLIGLDRVVLTPHIGGWAGEAQVRTQESVARDVARVLRGETPISPVSGAGGQRTPSDPSTRPEGLESGASGRGPLPILPYTTWEESGLPHPSATHPFGAVPGLRRIIATEGPLTADRAYKLYVRGSGSTRVTKLVRNKLGIAVNRLTAQNEVQIDELDNPMDNGVQRVIREPGSPAVVVREIGDRDLYEVPLNEVAAMMQRRMDRHPNVTHDQLMRHVLDTYGWRRLTDKARIYLTSAIRLVYED